MNEDTPKTNSVAYDVGGEQHDQGSIVPVGFARQLERELDRCKNSYALLCNAVMGDGFETDDWKDPVKIAKAHREAAIQVLFGLLK